MIGAADAQVRLMFSVCYKTCHIYREYVNTPSVFKFFRRVEEKCFGEALEPLIRLCMKCINILLHVTDNYTFTMN